MKYLKLFEKYEDWIGSGGFNVVSEIDNDWVLKEPLFKEEIGLDSQIDIEKKYGKGMPGVLKHFKEHIITMKKNPDIFPKVKLLSKNRAAVERCDTDKGIEYYYHFFEKITKNGYLNMPGHYKYYNTRTFALLMGDLNSKLTKSVLRYIKDNFMDDKICKEFYLLINLISKKFRSVDFRPENLGIDKSGKLKLIDF